MKLTCKLCNEVFEDELDMSMHLMYGHDLVTTDEEIEMPKFDYLPK